MGSPACITVTDASVMTTGNNLPGLLLLGRGGAGGPGGLINDPGSNGNGPVDDDTHDSFGGAGGSTGNGQWSPPPRDH